MTPVINLYSVFVGDGLGVAILLLILVTRGWNIPGRKEESRLLLPSHIVTDFSYPVITPYSFSETFTFTSIT